MSRKRKYYNPAYGPGRMFAPSSTPVADALAVRHGSERVFNSHVHHHRPYFTSWGQYRIPAKRTCQWCRKEGLINIFGRRVSVPEGYVVTWPEPSERIPGQEGCFICGGFHRVPTGSYELVRATENNDPNRCPVCGETFPVVNRHLWGMHRTYFTFHPGYGWTKVAP